MNAQIQLAVTEASQAGEARRTAVTLAERLGFDEPLRGKVALVVTEAASNLAKHAVGGELLLRPLEEGGRTGLEVLALDRGPGMADPALCLRDGYSSAGTAGKGLGAILRLADTWDLHTLPGRGTALLARLWGRSGPAQPPPGLEVGAVCLPKPGETVCGDAWTQEMLGPRCLLLVADGLGHGPAAATAAQEAIRLFQRALRLDPVSLLQTLHAGLRGTRGAAVAAVELDREQQLVRFAGVGNISGTLISPAGSRHLASHNGTVGHEARRFQEFTYPWTPQSLLVLHSDGLGSQWRLDAYPGLVQRAPSLVAGVLYRDFKRGRDDVTVVVAREVEPASP